MSSTTPGRRPLLGRVLLLALGGTASSTATKLTSTLLDHARQVSTPRAVVEAIDLQGRQLQVGNEASDTDYVEARAQTAVSVSATAYDERPEDASGCGDSGCLPALAYDGIRDDAGSRWSCAKKIVPDGGQCEIVFSFESPQDIMGMKVSFWKGDERTRSLKVKLNGEKVGEFDSTAGAITTTYDIQHADVRTVTLESIGLDTKGWISLLEVNLMVAPVGSDDDFTDDGGDDDSDQTCSNGLPGYEASNVCCPLSCGKCGGNGCSKLGEGCCTSGVKDSGDLCSETKAAPCIIDDDVVDDQTCSNGLPGYEASKICCPLSCGKCGGSGCSKLGEGCCTSDVKDSGDLCSETKAAPCIIDDDDVVVDDRMCSGGVPGILVKDVCCPTTCGSCAGAGCTKRDGGDTFTGWEACCGGGVRSLGRVCSAEVGSPCVVAEGEEEFEGLGIPGDLQELILEDAVGGFAGPGAVSFSDSSPEPILASEADSFVIDGVFAREDGEPLDPATILHLYIFHETSSGGAASRGTAAVDPVTGAFAAAVTDVPAGESTLVMSFVLDQDGGGGVGRRLAEAAGKRSVHTVSVVNPTDCTNALAITLQWDDGDSDIDLHVLEPGQYGESVYFNNKNGGFGFLDFDNTVGYGPENYVLKKNLKYSENLFKTFHFSVHGYRVLYEDGETAKSVSYKVVVRKEGEEVFVQNGVITHNQWTPDFTVVVDKKYVLAVGGVSIGGSGPLLNHYSLMQWEGLFPCLPELDNEDHLQEWDIEAFQDEYPTARLVQGMELLPQGSYTAWIRKNNFPSDDCWDEEDNIGVSRLCFSNPKATVVMPVQWDMSGLIWNDVVTNANMYEYAEPPVVCSKILRTTTRWPKTRYQYSFDLLEGIPYTGDANNSNTFIRWLVKQLGVPFREIDESGLDTYPGREEPGSTDRAGYPLDSTFYGPIWDTGDPPAPAPANGGLGVCD